MRQQEGSLLFVSPVYRSRARSLMRAVYGLMKWTVRMHQRCTPTPTLLTHTLLSASASASVILLTLKPAHRSNHRRCAPTSTRLSHTPTLLSHSALVELLCRIALLQMILDESQTVAMRGILTSSVALVQVSVVLPALAAAEWCLGPSWDG